MSNIALQSTFSFFPSTKSSPTNTLRIKSHELRKPLSIQIPTSPDRPRFVYSEPPPVPPQDNSKPRRKPNYVPIIITEELKASVQRALPDSPEYTDEAPQKNRNFAQSIYSDYPSSLSRKARHIPIRIPDFAQPYNPFPPSPPPSSAENTPREPRTRATSQELASPMRPAVTPMGPIRPSTADSAASTSPESLHPPNNQSQSSFSTIDDNLETSTYGEPRSRQPVDQTQGLTESMAALSTSQTSNIATTNLSGLMCNVHRCTGKEPHGLVGATTTIVGDKLYVFGGKRLSKRRPQLTSDLYELDLIRRNWTRLETSGDVPAPRYFHSVCALGDSKLICYGGMSPAPNDPTGQANGRVSEQAAEVIVMSDVHIYDIAAQSWKLIKTMKPGPQGRYAHCAAVLPSSAVFSSPQAPVSAIKHNASTSNPNEGSLGYSVDGSGGAEMIVVGGQDSANSYIEQISVFNLRSMEWTSTQTLGRSCGAYRSVVAPLTGMSSSTIGTETEGKEDTRQSRPAYNGPASMLIYSNYNFLDVKLELQVRQADGSLTEKPMPKINTPPGLRFPSGGVLDNHFLISGTFLTSSKQEYALWALNLKTLTWMRIDAGNSVFSQGSWNRGILWARRNTFVILGNRKRQLIEDYNHRRINFSNICLVELEAFGYYDNPRRVNAASTYSSASAPSIPPVVRSKLSSTIKGGRPHFSAAEELGIMAANMKELADMEIECLGGERIPANSHILSRRWGAYFVHAIRNGAASTTDSIDEGTDTATLRAAGSAASRNSSITITPSVQTALTANTTLTGSTKNGEPIAAFYPPTSINLPPASRSRILYLPHTSLTVQALLHYLYTSSLPPSTHFLCTPQILCSLLQIARPYCIDGLLEAVVERLHQVTDGRNAPAVFNASAMAAGGGRGTAKMHGNLPVCEENAADHEPSIAAATNGIRKARDQQRNGNESGSSSAESSDDNNSFSSSESDVSRSVSRQRDTPDVAVDEEVWGGDKSCVIGLQKRGLRGLMEGRRLRERGKSVGVGQSQTDL